MVLMVAFSAVLVAISLWGLWIAQDVARLVPSGIVSDERRLQGMVFWLTWLVCFAPFLCFAGAILWSLFRPEDHSWLVPLRWFTFIVSLRASAEQRTLSNKAEQKMLPPGKSSVPDIGELPPP